MLNPASKLTLATIWWDACILQETSGRHMPSIIIIPISQDDAANLLFTNHILLWFRPRCCNWIHASGPQCLFPLPPPLMPVGLYIETRERCAGLERELVKEEWWSDGNVWAFNPGYIHCIVWWVKYHVVTQMLWVIPNCITPSAGGL